jgi:hypothetical protein
MKLGIGNALIKKKNELVLDDSFSEKEEESKEKNEDEIENDMEKLDDFKISQIVMNVGKQNAGQQKGNK